MKSKKEYLILAAVIAVLVVYLVLRNTDHTLYQLPVVDGIESAEITKIEIRKPDGAVLLEKKDDQWFVEPEGYRADSNKIEKLLDAVASLTVTALVSESKSYTRYGLDPEKKLSVKAWAGDTLVREVDIGKAASTFRHTHVKLPKDPNVYHATGNFRNTFDQAAAYFRDMTVLSFRPQDIQSIEIIKQDQTATIARRQIPVAVDAKESDENTNVQPPAPKIEWQRSDGKGLDASAVFSLLNSLSSLRCEDYMDDKTAPDFGKPELSISFKGLETHTLSVFEKKEKQGKQYPATSSDADAPFVLSASNWERIAPKIDALFQ